MDEAHTVLQMFVGATVGGMIGGGAIAALAYRALKDKLIGDLERVFARASRMDSLERQFCQLQTVTMSATEAGTQNATAILRLQEHDVHDSSRLRDMLERIERWLDDLDNRQRASEGQLGRMCAVLDSLEKRIDRHERGWHKE
jgi:hypothetical protein